MRKRDREPDPFRREFWLWRNQRNEWCRVAHGDGSLGPPSPRLWVTVVDQRWYRLVRDNEPPPEAPWQLSKCPPLPPWDARQWYWRLVPDPLPPIAEPKMVWANNYRPCADNDNDDDN